MKTNLIFSLATVLALPAWAADPADEIKAAAGKLADQPNYSWTAKVESAQQNQQNQPGRGRGFGGGSPPSGKMEKGGFAVLTYKIGDNTTEAVRKGDKVAIKSEDEWKTAEELTEDTGGGGGGGGFNPQRFLARRVQQAKFPAAEAQELAGRVKELKKDGDAYSGELTAEALKQMFTFGGRQGGGGGGGGGRGAPDTSGLKGTAKFWVKDGALAKYETHVQGKMTFGQDNQEREINRTTTVEIKDVGSTKVEVPAEAKKKLKA